jgi:hypothetical protein
MGYFSLLVLSMAANMTGDTLGYFYPLVSSFFYCSSQAEAIQINELLASHCTFPDRSFVLYADAGFAVGRNLITPFRRTQNQTDQEAAWNT